MERVSVTTVLAVLAAPLALFRRKGRDDEVALEPGAPSDARGAGAGSDQPSGDDWPPEPAWASPTDASPTDASPTDADVPLRRTSRTPRPAPHRQRPGELWHAPIEGTLAPMPPALVPEERIDPSELVEADGAGQVPSPPPLVPGDPAPAGGEDQPVEVLRGADVEDDPAPATRVADPPRARPFVGGDLGGGSSTGPTGPTGPSEATGPSGPTGGGGDAEGSRPRIRPPADIFDVAPTEVPITATPTSTTPTSTTPTSTTPTSTPTGTALGSSGDGWATPDDVGGGSATGLIGGPVARRGARSAASRRSLFGAGDEVAPAEQAVEPGATAPGDGSAGSSDGSDAPEGPAGSGGSTAPAGRALAIDDDGEVVTGVGVIRLAERLEPDVIETSERITLTIGSGWCWIASAHASLPVQLTVPSGVLTAHPSCRCLAVVQADGSTFVSVVSGSVTLEHDIGLDRAPRELGAGTIAHVPVGGELTTDTATPDEMAADEILTRNLRLDDARAAEPRDTRSA